jgi:succinoglycan biosynthesis protein ExoA
MPTLAIPCEAAMEVLRLSSRGDEPRPREGEAQARDATARSASVVVPLRPGAPEPRALEALERMAHTGHPLEVLLSRGECPSRQRNIAARVARGDVLLFLDDDSVPSPDLVERYLETFRGEPDLSAAGGPALHGGGSFPERLVAALLSEPLVTGRSAARYSARGPARRSDERELILANLAVRRSAFERAGGFEESLYPNEENLFLERLRDLRLKIRYDPSALVTRPAPALPFELFGKVFGYGRGRAAQATRRFSRPSAVRVSAALALLISLCAAGSALPWTPLPLLALAGVLLPYHVLLLARISLRAGFLAGILAPFLASGIHVAYALGILSGLIWRLPTRGEEVSVERKICLG